MGLSQKGGKAVGRGGTKEAFFLEVKSPSGENCLLEKRENGESRVKVGKRLKNLQLGVISQRRKYGLSREEGGG